VEVVVETRRCPFSTALAAAAPTPNPQVDRVGAESPCQAGQSRDARREGVVAEGAGAGVEGGFGNIGVSVGGGPRLRLVGRSGEV